MKKIGDISHYYTNIQVGILELEEKLSLGDSILIQGATTDFTQDVRSMQIEGDPVEEVGPGAVIGLKVEKRVREGDEVYKLE